MESFFDTHEQDSYNQTSLRLRTSWTMSRRNGPHERAAVFSNVGRHLRDCLEIVVSDDFPERMRHAVVTHLPDSLIDQMRGERRTLGPAFFVHSGYPSTGTLIHSW